MFYKKLFGPGGLVESKNCGIFLSCDSALNWPSDCERCRKADADPISLTAEIIPVFFENSFTEM